MNRICFITGNKNLEDNLQSQLSYDYKIVGSLSREEGSGYMISLLSIPTPNIIIADEKMLLPNVVETANSLQLATGARMILLLENDRFIEELKKCDIKDCILGNYTIQEIVELVKHPRQEGVLPKDELIKESVLDDLDDDILLDSDDYDSEKEKDEPFVPVTSKHKVGYSPKYVLGVTQVNRHVELNEVDDDEIVLDTSTDPLEEIQAVVLEETRDEIAIEDYSETTPEELIDKLDMLLKKEEDVFSEHEEQVEEIEKESPIDQEDTDTHEELQDPCEGVLEAFKEEKFSLNLYISLTGLPSMQALNMFKSHNGKALYIETDFTNRCFEELDFGEDKTFVFADQELLFKVIYDHKNKNENITVFVNATRDIGLKYSLLSFADEVYLETQQDAMPDLIQEANSLLNEYNLVVSYYDTALPLLSAILPLYTKVKGKETVINNTRTLEYACRLSKTLYCDENN